MKKRFQVLAILFGAAASAVGAAYYFLFRRPLPEKSGVIKLKGLQNPVEIFRDRWGIPHIYSAEKIDAFFAQGFIHAQERLWQMDFNRRLVAGRVSELFGSPSINLDRWMRTLGMRYVAEKEAELLDPEITSMLDAYAKGVNSCIDRGKLPLEFNLLRYKPEPWTIVDSLSWSKMMAWNLSVNWEAEILRAMLIQKLGPELATELEPGYSPDWPTIIPPGIDYSVIGVDALRKAADGKKFTGPSASQGIGSNNWVISGKLTASGKPLLANDMHLGLTAPAIWYENHLSSRDYEISGVSFPGLPGIISGHNSHVAWGFTNGFPDVQDLYIERLLYHPDGTVSYEYDGQFVPAELRQETIKVRGQSNVTEKVVLTHHGPIINCLWNENPPEQTLALHWTALEPSQMIKALFLMNQAKSCLDLREALRYWNTPVQNVVSADIEGNIAYDYPGAIPIRRKGDGRTPVPGWTSDYEWEGYIPFEELPHQYNPPQGFIATANNCVTNPDYPHWFGSDFANGTRARRITELIINTPKIDVAFIKNMQTDWHSSSAVSVTQALLTLEPVDPEIEIVLRQMRDWDGNLAIDSSQASVYQVFCLKFLELILLPRLGPDLTSRYMGKGPTPVLSEGSIFAEHAREFLLDLLKKESSPWFDLGNGESRAEVMTLALRQAINYLKDNYGPSFKDWHWGRIHTLSFPHVLSAIPALKRLFNRGPYPIGGDGDTIWASLATRFDLTQNTLIGPPYRLIVDFSNFSNCYTQLVPGQSGHPASPHYADNISAWFKGEYHPMMTRFSDIKQNTEAQLRLEPQ